MPLFSRRAQPDRRLPADILTSLERFGRFSYDPQNNQLPGSLEADMYMIAQDDRDGFLAALIAVTAPAGGWVSYGAMKLVMSILGGDLDQSDYNTIVLAGLQFLRSHGVPTSRLSMNEMTLWHRMQGDHELWLVGRAAPPDTLTQLRPGEMRRVAQVFPGPQSNVIYVRQAGPDSYAAVIDGEWSEEDPRRVQNDWHTARSLHELYLRIGDAFQVPCYWVAPELEPYIPLPSPTV
jgi:hypothetical protein